MRVAQGSSFEAPQEVGPAPRAGPARQEGQLVLAPLELRRAAREAGLSTAFVPTGQTGIMIEGWGVEPHQVVQNMPADVVEKERAFLVQQAQESGKPENVIEKKSLSVAGLAMPPENQV